MAASAYLIFGLRVVYIFLLFWSYRIFCFLFCFSFFYIFFWWNTFSIFHYALRFNCCAYAHNQL